MRSRFSLFLVVCVLSLAGSGSALGQAFNLKETEVVEDNMLFDAYPYFIEFGTATRSVSNGHVFESVNHSLGALGDRALKTLEEGWLKRGLRLGKSLIDYIIAELALVAHHELAHAEYAVLHGSKSIEFVVHEGNPATKFEATGMSEEQLLEISSAGINASQAFISDARFQMYEYNTVHWSIFKFLRHHKVNTAHYVAFPYLYDKMGYMSEVKEENLDGYDTFVYRNSYASFSGFSREQVQTKLLYAAIYNLADPLFWWSMYSYLYHYIYLGETEVAPPSIEILGMNIMVSTGFWLSQVGPYFRLPIIVQEPEAGRVWQVVPSISDKGQWGLEGTVSLLKMFTDISVAATGHIWHQLESERSNTKKLGGGLMLRMSYSGFDWMRFVLNAGLKSSGALMGQPFKAGGFVSFGVAI